VGTGPDAFSVAMAAALRRAYGGRHSAIKIVAEIVGANERTVRNWFEAKNGPSGEYLVQLISHSEEMLASLLTLAGKREFVVSVEMKIAKAALSRALEELAKVDQQTSA
jgi:hypothetical protein